MALNTDAARIALSYGDRNNNERIYMHVLVVCGCLSVAGNTRSSQSFNCPRDCSAVSDSQLYYCSY